MKTINHENNHHKTDELEKEKFKPIKKTIYINRRYYDVLPYFDKKGSGKLICELIRQEMKRLGESDVTDMPDESERMIREIHKALVKAKIIEADNVKNIDLDREIDFENDENNYELSGSIFEEDEDEFDFDLFDQDEDSYILTPNNF